MASWIRACVGVFDAETTELFLGAIRDLKAGGAECVILGCTEIPIVVTPADSALPVLDSTRLLARYAVDVAIHARPCGIESGWLDVASFVGDELPATSG